MAESDIFNETFPLEHYLEVMVRLLDAVRYRDVNHTQTERRDILHHVYTKTAEHFSSPLLQRMIQAEPRVLHAAINSIVPMVVYCWAKVTIEQMVDLSIQFTLTLLLDDSADERGAGMESFFMDLVDNRPQRNAWWRLFNNQFPVLLKHYGPFCSLTLFRSALDCKFTTLLRYHPRCLFLGKLTFLRRLTGLGQFVGASLFPGTQEREQELMVHITSVMPHLDHWEIFVNDVMSFFKEFDCVDDQAILVRNYMRCGPEASIEEALDRVGGDAISRSEILCRVFRDNKDMEPHVAATVEAFCQGYITWHLTNPRYRLRELGRRAGDSATARRFREYLDAGAQAGIDAEYWAYPSVAAMAEAQLRNEAFSGQDVSPEAAIPSIDNKGPELQPAFIV
ncbi:hypothetical protein INS49_000256 [Diaporthe citri]|uniref:uncharacterized protein n=1 Tax=Diaporthe citri TaxID=83186 RepID=UPI001C7F9878|nr:uncharacterized protein INS49_000256 [Diaporthe citri]KAG6366080.1 hypothetical protein INS49_000256 [Diaporthe citri]